MSELELREAGDRIATPAAPPEPVGAPARRGRHRLRWRAPRRPGPALALSLAWLALVLLAVLVPAALTSADPLATEPAAKLSVPSADHLFGTDQLGRDLLSRVVHGADPSLRAAFLATLLGLVAGALLGLVAGFFRRLPDTIIMRAVDVILSIPNMLASLALIALLGSGTAQVALAVGFAGIANCARVMRAEVLRVRESVFVEAARASGNTLRRVLLRHVLPNSIGPVLALGALQFGVSILAVSSLSFLGYGVRPPDPEWGSLISSGRDSLATAWWLTTLPGVVVVLTVLAANRVARALGGEGR
ncbi:ABC transporter permease [Actinomadura rugatobispora]|uniref:ABC transporter permease n=1 Tax=Actinomadura rugatobispora TaxID=1994 RepID=A0ABW0ZVV2_9ACTN|nr:ABC transporter permease [Actinomadura rugatobispora]